jgi:hypothetical protein
MSLTLTKATLDRYFKFLSKLDIKSKKSLIIKLTESIRVDDKNEFDLATLYGAWEDSRSSDDIIADIKNSRVEKQNTIGF